MKTLKYDISPAFKNVHLMGKRGLNKQQFNSNKGTQETTAALISNVMTKKKSQKSSHKGVDDQTGLKF